MRIGASEYLTTREVAQMLKRRNAHAAAEFLRRRRHLIQPVCYGSQNLWDRREVEALMDKEAKRRGRAA